MSITRRHRSGTAATVAGEHDDGGVRGIVHLTADRAAMTPGEARALVRDLERAAARADDRSGAARLGAAGGRAAAAALTPEQRRERGRKAIAARWARRANDALSATGEKKST